MKIVRVNNLSEDRFIEEYLIGNKPVIITDAMNDWNLSRFQPDSLKKEFGDEMVQVYDDLFDLQDVDSLAKYLDNNFNRKPGELSKQYIRWYTKLKDVEFYWSDKVFSELKEYWSHPYFLPQNSLAVPFCTKNENKNINEALFPYKGLFISGKGSRTKFHKDPFNSNAVLCQFYGEKKIFLFNPNQSEIDKIQNELKDLKGGNIPNFSESKPDYEDTLKPGEMVLFPAGWYHDVTCLSDSISITWNFVHSKELEGLFNHLINQPNDDQIEILRFFLKDHIKEGATIKEIINFYKDSFQEKAMSDTL